MFKTTTINKNLVILCVFLGTLAVFKIFGSAGLPDISMSRIAFNPPEDLGTATNCNGAHAVTTFTKAVTNLAVAFQVTNLQAGITYEIRLHSRGATATPNVTITAETGQAFSFPNGTAAQTITYGSPVANATLRIFITPGSSGTNYLDFRDNYK